MTHGAYLLRPDMDRRESRREPWVGNSRRPDHTPSIMADGFGDMERSIVARSPSAYGDLVAGASAKTSRRTTWQLGAGSPRTSLHDSVGKLQVHRRENTRAWEWLAGCERCIKEVPGPETILGQGL